MFLPELSEKAVVDENKGLYNPTWSEEQEPGMICQKRRILSMNLKTESSKKQHNEGQRSADWLTKEPKNPRCSAR